MGYVTRWLHIKGVGKKTADKIEAMFKHPVDLVKKINDGSMSVDELEDVLRSLGIKGKAKNAVITFANYHRIRILADGSSYRGDWVNGERHGTGKIWYKGELLTTYVGDWVHNKRHGKGLLFWSDGARYDGEWKDDKRNGRGKMLFKDGATYEGDWVNGKPNGRGEFRYTHGAVYEGDCVDGKKNGRGELRYNDGASYTGDWVRGRKYGTGKMKYANGDTYVGEWAKNKKNGFGVFSSTSWVYRGNWKNGKRFGAAMITYNNSRFEGTFKNDRATGTKVIETRGRSFVEHGFVSKGSYEFHRSEATTECVICLQPLDEDKEPVIKISSCGHVFHLKCIRQTFKRGNICPVCRNPDTTLKYVVGNKTDGYKLLL